MNQFYADTRTLPDVMLGLTSVSRRYLPGRSSVANQVWPAVLGTSTLAAAAGVLFLMPFPEMVERPEDRVLTPDEVDQLNQPALSVPGYGDQPPQTNPEPTITPLEAPSGDRPTNNSDSPQDEDGGSDESDQSVAPRQADPVAQRSPQPSAEKLKASNSAPESGRAKIFDPQVLSQLKFTLRQSINQAWRDREAVQEDLEFRVGVAADGKVVGYRPVNQPAKEFRSDALPLRKILFNPVRSSGAAPKQDEPLALFKVVLTDEGKTQVSPLLGSDGKPVFHPPVPSSGNNSGNQSGNNQAGE